MYSSMKEDTVWSFDRLQSYIDEKYANDKGLSENWVNTTFTVRLFISYTDFLKLTSPCILILLSARNNILQTCSVRKVIVM